MDKDKKNKKGSRQQTKREEVSEKKTKTQKKRIDDDDDSEDEVQVSIPQPNKKKTVSAFAMLQNEDEDDDDDKSESSDSEQESKVKKPAIPKSQPNNQKKATKQAKGGKKGDYEDIDAILAEFSDKSKQDKKGKKQKKGAKEVDEILEEENVASIPSPVPAPQQNAVKIQTDMTEEELARIYDQMGEEYEEEDRKKKKKGKQQPQKVEMEVDPEESGDDNDDAEGVSTMKSAAQKKKEKKERQKAEKKTQQAKPKPVAKENVKKESTPAPQEVIQEEVGDSKDKKKKKGDGKEEVKPAKKPNKTIQLLRERQIQEQLEVERRRKEEEERIKREEEEERLREEKERLEKEKKEKKKQKEKDRIKKLKAEGKFQTEKQKEDRKRAQQMLETYKAQGVETNDKNELPEEEIVQEKTKRIVYTNKKKKSQQLTSPITPPTEPEPKPLPVMPVKEEKVESDDDVKDNWDDSDCDEDVSPAPETAKAASANAVPKVSQSSRDEDDDDDDDDDSSSDEEESEDERTPRDKALEAIEKRKIENENNRSDDNLRAPVICVLGHVDTGKTKILDRLRRTHVQDGEAGGITQQIGATNVPHNSIKEQIKMCKEFDLKLPGLLIIDTPGHESFSNLRTRGSSLCDLAILVVDIMHGLEQQTIESINILKQKKTPFVVALNKIDRLHEWTPNCRTDVIDQMKKQKQNTKLEFEERVNQVIVQFAEQGLNARLFYENKNPREFISLVPTSAHTGDGIGNLIALICQLTQTMMLKKIRFTEELQATVMEVKAISGLGTTIDIILVNGRLTVGNTIVVAGQDGPIVTQIRSLMLPPPMQEIRVKSNFENHKEVVAAQGCKITGKDLEKALAGLPLFVAHNDEEVEIYKEELSQMLKDVLSSIKLQEKGVYVQASTLGSLEALLCFLKASDIPYSGINIGPVHRKDVMKTMAMLEHDPQFACILAFDVKVERDAQEMADNSNIQIFTAPIIYHLFDNFMAFREKYKKQKQEEFKHLVMFPCKVKILPNCVFKSRDPIVAGVVVEAGFIKQGTILCVPSKNFVELGRVSSIEVNNKELHKATKGMEVCLKIESIPGEAPKMVGRHFEETDELVSKISRASIDAVKSWFRDEMTKTDWQLIMELKKTFGII